MSCYMGFSCKQMLSVEANSSVRSRVLEKTHMNYKLTMIIEAVPLQQIDDFELVDNVGEGILYTEVVPLCVSLRVQICLQNQLILKLTPAVTQNTIQYNTVQYKPLIC